MPRSGGATKPWLRFRVPLGFVERLQQMVSVKRSTGSGSLRKCGRLDQKAFGFELVAANAVTGLETFLIGSKLSSEGYNPWARAQPDERNPGGTWGAAGAAGPGPLNGLPGDATINVIGKSPSRQWNERPDLADGKQAVAQRNLERNTPAPV